MRSRRLTATIFTAAVAGSIIGLAPTALAWGTNAGVQASCWRTIGSSNATWGGDAWNYSTGAGITYYHYVDLDTYLKYRGSDIDFMRDVAPAGDGRAKTRRTRGNVVGGSQYSVYAYAKEAPGKNSTQKINSCSIT